VLFSEPKRFFLTQSVDLEAAMSHKLSDPTEPSWPKQRNLDRYNMLVGDNIETILKNGGLWIDVGPGADADPMRPLVGRPGVVLKAIGPHPRQFPDGIAFTNGLVPQNIDFLNENQRNARLVTDIFGAVSYSANPVHALIYEGLLLAKNGICAAFTELERFGDLKTWGKITEFFRTRLDQAISFQSVSVFGDASRRFSTELRIRCDCKRPAEGHLNDLFVAADRDIGVPQPGARLWISPDKSAEIRRVEYVSKQ
jgi:hypothetical protein